jgi:hypothetical protein
MPRPQRPYKNFAHFGRTHGATVETPYPCLTCDGLGWFYREARGRCYPINCNACGQTGQGTKAACRQAYREALWAFRAEKEEYIHRNQIRQQALQKLTAEEIQILRELGL